MNNVKNDELSIYGEYARRAKRVTLDFFLELFLRKIYADDPDLLSADIPRLAGLRAEVGRKISVGRKI